MNLIKKILLESKFIDFKTLQKIQSNYSWSSDTIFGANPSDNFELVEIPIKSIKIDNKIPKVDLLFYITNGLHEDINIVEELVDKYSSDKEISPIVIDENNNIMDGIHRYVAQKELGYETIKVYKRIK